MIKILVADDHPVIRAGIKQIVSDTPDIVIAGEAGNGTEVLKKIRNQTYDVVLLDLSMPGISGIDVLKQLKKEKPGLEVLVLSRYPEEQYAIPCLKAGATGYIPKTSLTNELINAIRKASMGREYASASLSEELVGRIKNGEGDLLHLKLSAREMEIMCLIAMGKSVTDIAEEYCLSPSTVSTYRSRIMKKMRLKNDAELVRYAIEHELI